MDKSAPQIRKVKDPPKEKPRKELHLNLPQLPCIMTIVAPTKSGKTNLLSNLLLRDDFYKDIHDNITIMSNSIESDVTGRFLRQSCDCYTGYSDEVLGGIITQQKSFSNEDRPFIGLVFDDILGSVKRNSYLNSLVTR